MESDLFKNHPLSDIVEELACEYTGLFLGPGKHIPLNESAYKSGKYWNESTVEFKNIIETYGLKITEKFNSIPDHISVMFELMAKLINKETSISDSGNEINKKQLITIQKEIFCKHVITWIPDLCKQIEETALLDFYKEFALLTKDFLIEEEKVIG